MSAITPSLFGYYDENQEEISRSERALQAVPLVGSLISMGLLIEAIKGRALNDDGEYGEQITCSQRIQRAIRGAIGLIPVVGFALIPIDLVATLVDAVRHEIYRRQALRD